MRRIQGELWAVIVLALAIISGLGQGVLAKDADSTAVSDSLKIHAQIKNLHGLQSDLTSGKPTLAFFYYSVACSCTAARCAIAAAAIDSIPELKGKNALLNFGAVDAYFVPEADSLYSLMIMPAVLYFDKDGKEINRLEWGTSREAIKHIIEHPEIKQLPID